MLDYLKSYIDKIPADAPGILVTTILMVVFLILIAWHALHKDMDMRDLVVNPETDRVSVSHMGQFIALVVSTLVLWYQMLHHNLSEWLFTGYMLTWAGANVASQWITKNAEVKQGEQHTKRVIATQGSGEPAPLLNEIRDDKDDGRVFESETVKR